MNLRYFKVRLTGLLLFLLSGNSFLLAQNCPSDKGYDCEYVSLESQLGNLKPYIDIGFCKQVTGNNNEQEIFAIIKKKKPVLSENILVSFEITFKTKSQKEIVMKGSPEFRKDQFIRQGWGSTPNQDMQLIVDDRYCFGCDSINVISATLDNISIQFYSGDMKDSIITREKKAEMQPDTSSKVVLGANNKFAAPPPPVSPKLPFDTSEYKLKVNEKIQDFQENIRSLSNSKSRLLIDNTIEQTLKLFINNGADVSIEISSKSNKTARKIPVAQYLNNLTRLKYQKVEIMWTRVFIADNFYKGTDGNWYATVTFDQIFRGINDGVVAYSDVTRKKIEIQLRTYMKDDQLNWDVFLGNTTVEETKGF